MRIGVIGCGVIARYYLAALETSPDFDLVAVADLDRSKTETLAAGGLAVFGDYRDLLAAGVADAAIINLPNHLHAEACEAALSAGLHTCCEKPLTIAPSDAERLVACSREAGRTLFTAFHRRYNEHVVRLQRSLGSAAPVVHVEARYCERIEEHAGSDLWYLDPERCGGGCVADNGPNVFDTLRMLVGEVTVTDAALSCWRRGVEYRAEVSLRTAAGADVAVDLDWGYEHGEAKDIAVVCADGTRLEADMLEGFPAFKSSLNHEYERILADFARRIREGGEHGRDGLAAVRLVAATYDAARSDAAGGSA